MKRRPVCDKETINSHTGRDFAPCFSVATEGKTLGWMRLGELRGADHWQFVGCCTPVRSLALFDTYVCVCLIILSQMHSIFVDRYRDIKIETCKTKRERRNKERQNERQINR